MRTALLFLCVLGPALAADSPLTWDPDRTRSPETVAEAKLLQAKVREITARGSPSTVGVLVAAGAGSAVIVREDGLVLSCSHVLRQPGRTVRFVLSDGTTVGGKTLGMNHKTDSALARITHPPPKGATWTGAADGKWPAAPLGKAADLKKGQWVIALGHPGGPKADRPPVVRLGRFDTLLKADPTFRTDCAIVGGDTGGPVFDLHGRVVGIHTRIGLFVGISLHIPIEDFQTEWDRLLAGEVIGKATRAETGMGFEAGAKEPTVKRVANGGPAEKAGLKPGDVITEFDGEAIVAAGDVALIVHGLQPDQAVAVTVRRGREEVKVALTLGGAAKAK